MIRDVPERTQSDLRSGGSRHRRLRGQALVEFAIILPIVLLVVLGTVDLGRAFFTSITLENAAKEGVLLGARSPECDDASAPDCVDPATVHGRVQADLDGIALSGFVAKCFAPGTTDFTGAGKALDDCVDGDLYFVRLESPFELITPLMSALVGDTITIDATATAVVITDFGTANVLFQSQPAAPTPTPVAGTCTVPDFAAGPTKIRDADDVWEDIAGFDADNLTTNGSNNQSIVWQAVPAGTVGTCTTLTNTVSSSSLGTPTPSPTPTATPTPTPTPTATPGGGTPTPTPSATPTPTPSIAMCTVPHLVTMPRLKITQAQAVWTNAGFTAANFSAVRPPGNDYQVQSQSLAAGLSRPCLTASIQVDN